MRRKKLKYLPRFDPFFGVRLQTEWADIVPQYLPVLGLEVFLYPKRHQGGIECFRGRQKGVVQNIYKGKSECKYVNRPLKQRGKKSHRILISPLATFDQYLKNFMKIINKFSSVQIEYKELHFRGWLKL